MTSIFQSVLTASFYGSIVILAVLVLRLILRKAAPKKYLCYLWVLVGIRLLMPFDIQSDFSLQPESPPQTLIRWEQPDAMWSAEALSPREPLPSLPDLSSGDIPTDNSLPASPADAGQSFPEELPSTEEAAFSPLLLLSIVWGGVALSFLAYNLYSYAALRKRVRDAREVPGGWEAQGIDTAFILGFIKPRIYIPAGMSQDTRDYILAHERTHLDKADHWLKMLGFLALAIHWFNPLVWLAYFLLCKDIEMACDERVVQFMDLPQRKAYSTALLNCSSNHPHYAVSPVAFGEVNVKNRIQSVLNYRSPSFWSGLLSVIAIIMVTVCLLTNPTRQASSVSAKDFTAATQPPMEENPDWGISLLAEPLSPTSMKLYYLTDPDVSFDSNAPITKEPPYTLESWNGKAWEPLPQRAAVPDYVGSDYSAFYGAYDGSYQMDTLDWTSLYGILPEGDYRIVLSLWRGEETRPFYAWFHIYANALAGEEAEALARVKAALNLLQNTYSYTATVSESSSQGQLLPTEVICKSYSSSSLNFYTGNYCYASRTCSSSDSQLSTWTQAFLPGENAYVSFPKASAKISDEEVCFTASQVDPLGQVSHTLCSYRMGEDGRLTEVRLLTQSQGEDGVLTQSQRGVSIAYTLRSYPERSPTPKDATQALQDSPWGISFQIVESYSPEYQPLTPTGCDIQMSINSGSIGVSHYTTDDTFWLEKWDENFYHDLSCWNSLETKASLSASQTYRLTQRACVVTIDWSQVYGALEPGLYRIGKRFSNGEETIIQYAEFLLYPTGTVQGQGGEEAMKRVYDAIDALCDGNYCVRKETISSFSQRENLLDRTFWKSGDLRLTEHPADRDGTHLVFAGDEDRSCRDLWLQELGLNDPHLQIFFPTGDSVISDEEISFTGALTYASYADALSRWTLHFDETGVLRAITVTQNIRYDNSYSTLYTVEPLSDGEIQASVEALAPLVQ